MFEYPSYLVEGKFETKRVRSLTFLNWFLGHFYIPLLEILLNQSVRLLRRQN
jgi:hypothetical protein